jgi:hypothetical protein
MLESAFRYSPCQLKAHGIPLDKGYILVHIDIISTPVLQHKCSCLSEHFKFIAYSLTQLFQRVPQELKCAENSFLNRVYAPDSVVMLITSKISL